MGSGITQTNFFDQLQILIDRAGLIGIFSISLGLLFLVALGLLGKRKALIGCYLVSVMFSGFAVESIDSGFRLFRWFVLFVLALTALRGVKSPGKPVLLMAIIATYGILVSVASVDIFFSFQQAVLMWILTVFVAPAISDEIQSSEDINRVMKFLIFMASLWLFLALISLGQIRQGERFSGVVTGAPVFVMTGGMLMPVTLWGLLSFSNPRLRYYCGVIFALIIIMCLISGQRTGSFAGIIACLPLLFQFKLRRAIGFVFLSGILALTAMFFLSFLGEQKEFVMERFFSTDTTGREELWQEALRMCMREPWFGHGFGTAIVEGTIFHNMYLTFLYTGGLGSMLLVILSISLLLWGALRLQKDTSDDHLKNLGKFGMGIGLGIAAASFFEQTIESPSNFTIFIFCLASIFVARGREIAVKEMADEYQGLEIGEIDTDDREKNIDYGVIDPMLKRRFANE